jgi:hypothetical protein
MVFCDAIRAVLVAIMVLPHVPIGALVALLFAATMFAPPFESAKASITPDILSGDRYVLGTAVLQTTLLVGQVAGAAGAGFAVHFLGVRVSLVIDAVTFLLSSVLIASAPGPGKPRRAGYHRAVAAGADGSRIPAGVQPPGAADPAAVRLAGGLLHDPGGNRRPVCENPRRRVDRHRPGAGVHGAEHDDRHAAVHPVRPPAPAD